MKHIKGAALAAIMIFGTASAQEVEKTMAVKIAVEGDGKDIHWVSHDPAFSMEGLEVGETRTMTNESGETITVTRTGEGMQFDVDGEVVMIPDVGMLDESVAFIGGHDLDVDVVVADGEVADVVVVDGGPHAMGMHHPEGVTIISGEPLDDSVRESIRSVLISAGHDDEVTFIDGSGDGRQLKVVKKRVEIVN